MPTVRMPDGTNVNFPDDMPAEQIRSLIAQKFPQETGGKPATEDRTPLIHRGPIGRANQAFKGGVTQGLTANFGNEIMSGAMTPIELGIGAFSGEDSGKGLFERVKDAYGRAYGKGQAEEKAAYDANPVANIAGNITGGLITGGKLAQGGATLLNGAKPTIGSMALRGAGEGAAYGAVYGAGAGEGLKDRFNQAAFGAGTGAAFGGAAGAVGGYMARGPESRAGTAVSRALRDDGMTPQQAAQRLNDLGPDAVLADLGPNLQRQAGALASLPGKAQERVRNTLTDRSAGANARITGEINRTLGPARIPSEIDDALVASQRALGPQYEFVFRGARAVDTTRIANELDSRIVNLRGPAQRSLQGVRRMLNVVGQDVLDPNPRTLFEVRQAIDGLLTAEANPKVIGALSAVRGQIDDLLGRAVPGIKPIDAKFSELARQRAAVTRGQQVLDSGRTAPRPTELADEVAAGVQPQGQMTGPSGVSSRLRDGARAEIERIVGTNTNDVVALNRLVKGEGSWNRDRLVTLFGQRRADSILRVLERERAFAETAQTVMRNSETAARTAAQTEVAGPTKKPGILRAALNLNFGDALANLGDKGLGLVAGSRRAAGNEEIARLLMGRNTTMPAPQLSVKQKLLIDSLTRGASQQAPRLYPGGTSR